MFMGGHGSRKNWVMGLFDSENSETFAGAEKNATTGKTCRIYWKKRATSN